MDECSVIGEYMQNRTYLKLALDHSKDVAKEADSWGIFGTTKYGKIIGEKVVEKGVKVIERTMMTSLIMKDGRAAGAIGFPLDDDTKAIVINARAVIICTGGSGFKPNGYPINSLTSDGDAMSYRVGAEIGGKEFNDLHWTYFNNPGDCYANWKGDWQRGLGSRALSGPKGGLDLRYELAAHTYNAPVVGGNSPRPVKGVDSSAGAGRPSGGSAARPQGGAASGARAGGGSAARPQGGAASGGRSAGGRAAPGMRMDEPDNPIVGGGAAGKSVHKAEGLYPNDDRCASNIPGLYAAGDSLSSMHNGSDYSSGVSSICTSGVQGSIAAKAAVEYIANVKKSTISKTDLGELKNVLFAPRSRTKGFTPGWVTQILQNTMIPYFVLFVKKKERMEAALTNLEFIRDHFVPMLIARDAHELRLAHETENMVLNAEMKLRTGLFRTESRGSHFREDYPARDDANWLAYVRLKKNGNGEMVMEKVDLPKEWAPSYKISYEERYPLRYPGEEEYLKKNPRLRDGK
jgi:succinate dehydrogenase/fumarate reductase flavoprotein subunit